MKVSRLVFLILTLFLVPAAKPAFGACAELLQHDMKRLHSSETVNLCTEFGGRPLLVVNTASHCGFTPQFESLEALHQQFRDRGRRVPWGGLGLLQSGSGQRGQVRRSMFRQLRGLIHHDRTGPGNRPRRPSAVFASWARRAAHRVGTSTSTWWMKRDRSWRHLIPRPGPMIRPS